MAMEPGASFLQVSHMGSGDPRPVLTAFSTFSRELHQKMNSRDSTGTQRDKGNAGSRFTCSVTVHGHPLNFLEQNKIKINYLV